MGPQFHSAEGAGRRRGEVWVYSCLPALCLPNPCPDAISLCPCRLKALGEGSKQWSSSAPNLGKSPKHTPMAPGFASLNEMGKRVWVLRGVEGTREIVAEGTTLRSRRDIPRRRNSSYWSGGWRSFSEGRLWGERFEDDIQWHLESGDLAFGGHWGKSLPPGLGEGEERWDQPSDGPLRLQKSLRRQMKATACPLPPTPPRPTSRCLCPRSPLLARRRHGSRQLRPPPGQDTELVGAVTWHCWVAPRCWAQ